jgi:hypothetical protein
MIKAQASKENFKTLMEFCPSDANLELAVRAIARRKKIITADDLHQLDFSLLQLGRKRQAYGGILNSLANEGFLRKLGYVPSNRSTCHNRPVLQFEYVEGI